MTRFSVSRRTAERMRDAVCAVFPQVEEFNAGDGFKRWRIRQNRVEQIPVSTEELVALKSAATAMRHEMRGEQADMLDNVGSKLRSLLLPKKLAGLEPDYEALIEAEGLASRPGPRPRIDPAILGDLRKAIMACRQVRLHYRARGSGLLSRLPVYPYGFLYGARHYLLAFNPYEGAEDFRSFSLANIEKVDLLDDSFERDPEFDITAYAARSFGVFQEEPYDVVWRISAKAAADARQYHFHPTETFEEQPDGSLLLRFTAGGIREMCWHLFTWGGEIEVIEPPELIDELRRQLRLGRRALAGRKAVSDVSQEGEYV